MRLIVNGETVELELEASASVADLLSKLGYRATEVAVAIGDQIVARNEYGKTLIDSKTEIEILSPTQGG